MKTSLQITKLSYRRLTFFLLLLIGISQTILSCKKDEITSPTSEKITINITEIGIDNSKTVEIGSDLHVEGVIEADALIETIEIEMHQEIGDFKITKSYIEKYAGSRKTNFHEHMDIPEETPAGTYHFHINVTDKAGNSAEFEDDLTIFSKSLKIENTTVGSKETPDDEIAHIGAALYIHSDIISESIITEIKIIAQHKTISASKLEEDVTS